MNGLAGQREQWVADNEVLARIGAGFYRSDTRIPVEIPNELADAAVAAWHRDDPEHPDEDLVETDAQRLVRHRAGSLALIGAAIAGQGRLVTVGSVSVDLDGWFIGHALDAADDHGLITDPAPRSGKAAPGFVNLGLDIEGDLGTLDELERELCTAGIVMGTGGGRARQRLRFELVRQPPMIHDAVEQMVGIVDTLSPRARTQWNAASMRVFDVGIEAGRESVQPAIRLAPDLVARVAVCRAGIVFTHYPSRHRNMAYRHQHIV